jgi:hypothetical protein
MKHLTAVRVLLAVAAFFSLLLYVNYHYPRDFPTKFDDAYMSLRYARHWLAGDGFSWNVADGPSYGITSVTHLLLVTALCATTHCSDNILVSGLSYGAGLLAVATLVAIGFVQFKNLRKTWLPLLVLPAIVLGPSFPFHSLTGMETTLALLFNALFAAAALAFARRPSAVRMAVSLLAALACLLTRPDMGLYCFLVPPLLLLAEDRRRWKPGAIYGILLAILLAGHLLLNERLFGNYLPLPVLAKSAGFYRGYLGAEKWNPGMMLVTFLHESLPFLLVTLCFATRAALPRLAALFLPMLLTFGYYGTVTQIMGHGARYYYPSLSFLILGCYIAVDSFLELKATSSTSVSFAWLPRICVALLVLIGLNAPLVEEATASVWRKLWMERPEEFSSRSYPAPQDARQLKERSWWGVIQEIDALLGQMPPGTVLAASEYGYLGAKHPEIKIVDLVGLHDREVATHGFSIEYLLSQQPDLIWMPHLDYTHLRKQILDSDEFAEQYDYYPYVYFYGIAIRKDSPRAERIREILAKDFARVNPGKRLEDYKSTGPGTTQEPPQRP